MDIALPYKRKATTEIKYIQSVTWEKVAICNQTGALADLESVIVQVQ